jgi:hypothetical protein
MPQTPEEIQQLKSVLQFRNQLEPKGLIWRYKNAADFPDVVRPHLARVALGIVGAPIRPEAKPEFLVTSTVESESVAKQLWAILQDMGSRGVFVQRDSESPPEYRRDRLDRLADVIKAGVLVFTNDDKHDAIQQFLFELGYAMGRLGCDRTFILASEEAFLRTHSHDATILKYKVDQLLNAAERLQLEFERLHMRASSDHDPACD